MGERKIVSKYYHADFDPAKIFRRRQPINHPMKVRIMLPMTIRCTRCGVFISKGTKLNSKKENVGERYLGNRIFRFYVKCTNCFSEISFKTNPMESGYDVECGATTINFEADEEEKRRRIEVVGDPMKSLEARTSSMKRQLGDHAALLELQSR